MSDLNLDQDLAEQARLDIRDRYERTNPQPSGLTTDVAAIMKTIAECHVETMLALACRLAPHIDDRMEYVCAHFPDVASQKKFDEDVRPQILAAVFTNCGVTDQTASTIVTRHFGK